MNSFSSTCTGTTTTPPDPRKHVNYVQGMVLGADDLDQEFVYHQHQIHWLARDTIGYGTLSGLRVSVEQSAKGPEVSVTPGTALNPRGQLIRVAPRQCAALNSWLNLAETQEQLASLDLSTGGVVTAYVVLCFRDCETDPLPIPGEPCRCDSNTMAPSRVTDDFRLELRLSAPAQTEEDAIRDFVQWLRSIKITGATSGYTSIEDFLQAIRDAAHFLTLPVESPPDFLYDSPPSNLVLPSNQLCDYLRAALRLWVTELRPIWQVQWATQAGGGCGCHGTVQTVGADGEECLLLAAIKIPLMGGQVTDPTRVQVDDSARPSVVHLRMLQEWLLCGCCCAKVCHERTFATVFAVNPYRLRIWVHHPLTVHLTEAAVQLELNDEPIVGFSVAPVETTSDQHVAVEHNVFDLDLGESPPTPLQEDERFTVRFDTQLILEDASPVRSLADGIEKGCWCYPDFADDVVTVFGTIKLGGQSQPQPANAMPAAETFGSSGVIGTSPNYARADHVHPMPTDDILGDVEGKLSAASVVKLQGVKLAGIPTSPASDGNVLTFRNGVWEPEVPQPVIASGKFVEHPTDGRYLIVAAGHFRADGTQIGPVYNKLTATTPTSGNGTPRATAYLLGFGGGAGDASNQYIRPPDGKFMYIVKGTTRSTKGFGHFSVIEFEEEGIRVQVVPATDAPVDSFMVEISLYGEFES
jgi:hypothetical protein